jgi:hypothetical protein
VRGQNGCLKVNAGVVARFPSPYARGSARQCSNMLSGSVGTGHKLHAGLCHGTRFWCAMAGASSGHSHEADSKGNHTSKISCTVRTWGVWLSLESAVSICPDLAHAREPHPTVVPKPPRSCSHKCSFWARLVFGGSRCERFPETPTSCRDTTRGTPCGSRPGRE